MAKKTLADLRDLKGKRVLVRVDFNVPLDEQPATSPTTAASAAPCRPSATCSTPAPRVIVMSHLGRPEGRPRRKDALLTMDRVADRLRRAARPAGQQGATRSSARR